MAPAGDPPAPDAAPPPPLPRSSRLRHSASAETATSADAATTTDPPPPLPRHSRRLPATATAAAAAATATAAADATADSTAVASTAVTSAPAATAVALTAATGEWSSLPPEIVRLISLFLTNIWDCLRFRAVCSSWRSNCTARTPQTPCLLLPYDPDTTTRSFLDPSDFRINTIDIPEARGKWIYGTPHGWLVMLNTNNELKMRVGYTIDVSLLNPITRDHISLPPLPRDFNHMPEIHGGCAHSTKPFLTANPNSSSHGDFLALLIFYELVFCRLGGDVWTVVDLHVNEGKQVLDFTYFNGAFYVVYATRGITVVNATTLEKKYTAPPTPTPRYTETDFHLVESSGDLLLIEISHRVLVLVIEVFKLDSSGTMLKWVRIEDTIGDRTLFMSYNRSSISLSSGDYIRSQGDLICFAGIGYCYDDSNYMVANIRVSDVVAGSSTGEKTYWQSSKRACIVSDCLLGLTWIIPSLR